MPVKLQLGFDRSGMSSDSVETQGALAQGLVGSLVAGLELRGFYLLVLASLQLGIRYSKISCRKGQTLALSSSWNSPVVCDEGIHLGDFTARWTVEPCHTQPLAF